MAAPGGGGAVRQSSSSSSEEAKRMRREISRKVKTRLLPVLVLVVFASSLDRTTLAYAADDLKRLLGLSNFQYGLAASSTFCTYVLLQWPNAWVASRVGSRPWLGVLAFAWGGATILTAWVKQTWQLVVLRLIIGAAESGNFPLIYMKLDSFLSEREVASSWSWVMASSQVAGVVSGPLAALILQIPPSGPVVSDSWQWLFILEGALSVVAGVAVLTCLLDSPEKTKVLTDEEKALILMAGGTGGDERPSKAKPSAGFGSVGRSASRPTKKQATTTARKTSSSVLPGLTDWRSWYLGTISLLASSPVYVFLFFGPHIFSSLFGDHKSPQFIDAINAVPYAIGMASMLFVGQTVRLFGDRLYHGIIGMSIAAALALTYPLSANRADELVGFGHLSLLYGFLVALYIPLDTMAAAYTRNPAGSYPIVNSMKSCGGILAPPLYGVLNDAVGTAMGLAVFGLFEVAGLILFILFFFLIGQSNAVFCCTHRRRSVASQLVTPSSKEGREQV